MSSKLPTVEQLQQRIKRLEHRLASIIAQKEALSREREEFISVFNSINAGIYVADPNSYELLFVNKAIQQRATSGKNIIGKKCYHVLQNKSEPCSFCTNSIIFGNKLGKPYSYEIQNRVNGRWYHCIDRAIRWIDGRNVRFELAIDIDDRKKTEEALKESEKKYSTLVEHAHDGVFIIQDGTRKFSNKAMATIFGYTLKEFIDHSFLENILPDYRSPLEKRVQNVESLRENPQIYQAKIVRKDGVLRDVEMSISPIRYSGKPAIMGIIRDITDYRKMAENLWESEEKYRILHDYLDLHLPLHLGYSDESYKFRLWNRYSEVMLGYSSDEAIGKLTPDDIHETPEEAREVVVVAERDGIYDKEVNFVHQDGRKIPVHLVVVPKKSPDGDIIGLYGFAEDITERKKAETALKKSERRFRALVENSLVAIFICQDGKIVYKNPEYDRIFTFVRENNPIEDFEKRIHPEDKSKFKPFFEMCRSAKICSLNTDVRFIRNENIEKMSDIKWVQCRVSQIEYRGQDAVLVNMMDITRTKQLENILNVEDKMTSLGRVAAGIAHEIRSPLSGINILFDTLRQTCESHDRIDAAMLEEFRNIITKAQEASQRIESVVRRVLDFARPAEMQRHLTNLNQPVEEAVNLSKVTLRKEGITVWKDLDATIPNCYASPRMIEQVLMNLITNAIHAMKNCEKKKILSINSVQEGGHVVIRVADSGSGVPPSLHEKIFDPYFTTKTNGSGIGLSVSRRIVKDHDGMLEVSRSRWGGAAFSVKIPIANSTETDRLFAISFG